MLEILLEMLLCFSLCEKNVKYLWDTDIWDVHGLRLKRISFYHRMRNTNHKIQSKQLGLVVFHPQKHKS